MDDTIARSVFAGLAPERLHPTASPAPRTMNSTMPILLVGTMAMTMNLTAQVEEVAAKAPTTPGTTRVDAVTAVRAVIQKSTQPAPPTYRVSAGDTVSGIASRYGIPAASILSLNGLKSSSLIFPGQVLKLLPGNSTSTASTAVASSSARKYTVVAGDTISRIAARFGVTTAKVLSLNGLHASSVIRPGQVLRIPATGSAAPLNAVPVSSVTPIAPAPAATPAPAPAPAPAAPPAAPSGTRYVIVSGDTISAIAKKFGVTAQAILSANGLTASSVIYAGKTLLIPGTTGPATPTTAPTSTAGVTLLKDDQAANAFTIITVGRELGVSDYGIVIALATAMQESSLRNLSHGHLDSVGLFQQRPSSGWGSVAQLTTPSHAARLFYGGPSNPNRGKTRGLLDIQGWQSMTLTQAAQKVQISAYPNAYAKWEASARLWLSVLG